REVEQVDNRPGVAGVIERVAPGPAVDVAVNLTHARVGEEEGVGAAAAVQGLDVAEAPGQQGVDRPAVVARDAEVIAVIVPGHAVPGAGAAVDGPAQRAAVGEDEAVVAGAAGQVLDVGEPARQQGGDGAGVTAGDGEGVPGVVAGDRVRPAAAVD